MGRFDQRMYRWVNEAKLPLEKCLPSAPEILAILFDAEWKEANHVVWDPKEPCDGFRILLTGKAIIGTESPTRANSSEFDLNAICGIPSFLMTSRIRSDSGSGLDSERTRGAGSQHRQLQRGDGDETAAEATVHAGAMALPGQRAA